VIARLLEERAAAHPGKVLLRTAAADLTYAAALVRSRRLAAGLLGLGVGPGDPVLVLMRNSVEQVLVWLAANRIGAVHVPVNTALVGDGLAHTFRLTGARVAVVDGDLLGRLAGIPDALAALRTVVVNPQAGPAPAPASSDGAAVSPEAEPALPDPLPRTVSRLGLADLEAADGDPAALPVIRTDELEPAVMLFTSGTTGVSKACVLSHRYVRRQGELHARSLGLTADDVLYSPFPLFHIDAATLTFVPALALGGTAALGLRYSTGRFWDEVRAFDATVFNVMGATLTMLWKQPPSPRDREHRVRLAWGVPMPEWKQGFEQRFGFPLYEVYGLTDAGVPVYDPLDAPHRPGACGRVIDAFELAIAGPDGAPLPPGRTGEAGEILVRGKEPGLVMTEYFGMPEATAAAFRDSWFRTGDQGRLDGDGYLSFLGRSGDVIRRRGENISAAEVELAVETHPGVLSAAAIGVPSEWTEEDVMVVVVPRPGAVLTPEDLIAHLTGRLAAHMLPRYVDLVPDLPRTPTEKVEKFRLAERGVTPTTWDRDRRG
jgi:crotonobetaine/carnitine-CoA ligase